MKRLITMLLIVSSAAVPTLAQSKSKTQKEYDLNITMNKERQYPLRVFRLLKSIRDKFGMKEGQTYSVLKNPETGLVESSERITRFSCDLEELATIDQDFMADEPFSYQILHLLPGSTQRFDIKVVSADGQRSTTLPIRTKNSQEMWYLATKNLENPQLRDVYAIVWETDGIAAEGTIYGIASLRPDLYTKAQETSKKTFRIDGRVGNDLTDSLYVVYMANTLEELDALADDAFMEYMPVVNRRFSFSVEIDKPMVGRIRTVMPDGSLCHLWTNLDFVPGETYHITTHNGYYDEDRDYERRVGRQSGRSLLVQTDVRNVQVDTVVVDPDNIWEAETSSLSPEQNVLLEMKAGVLEADIDALETIYETFESELKYPRSVVRINLLFDRIVSQNKKIDADAKEFVRAVRAVHLCGSIIELYKHMLGVYSRQNVKLAKLSAAVPHSKKAKKAQEQVQHLMEKYLGEMSKL